MPNYLLQLGNTPELSLVELSALLPDVEIPLLDENIGIAPLTDDEAADQLLEKSGGIVKIARILEELPLESTEEQIETSVLAQLSALNLPKFKFAIGEWGRDHLEPLSISRIKKELQAQGLKVRYIDGPRQGLSASVLSHQSVGEVIIFQTLTNITLALTVSVQNIDAWSFRDRSKPYADRRKGMLPPKVARMMVNIAIGATEEPSGVLYDPFCGTGTVLIEALMRHCQVVGSDLDKDSVQGTKNNLSWAAEQLKFEQRLIGNVFTSDVSQVTTERIGRRVQYLVTEPFLGKPTPIPSQLPGIFKGLEKLYFGAFKRWTQLLNDGATIAMVMPMVQDEKETYSLEPLIDKIANLGYTTLHEPVVYRREQAIVQRQIYFLRFQSK